MEKYTGTKTIKATPLNLGEYNRFRKWDIPEDEDPKTLGYMVGYSDAKGNFDGDEIAGCHHISWSPKDVFESSYVKHCDDTPPSVKPMDNTTRERIAREHTHSKVWAVDEKGEGGAFHEYRSKNFHPDNEKEFYISSIKFQKGAMEEEKANGLHNEDLLHIVKHRLECFQEGAFACDDNQRALNFIAVAIRALERRTKGRRKRGVEGKLVL